MLRFRSQQNEQSYHVRYAYATKSMHTRAATLAPSTPLERIHPGWSCEAGRPDSQGLILLPLCCRATGIFVRSYSPLTPLSPPSEAQTSLRGSLALSLSLSVLFFTESLTALFPVRARFLRVAAWYACGIAQHAQAPMYLIQL